jgi:23S rRNA (guanosine2251-2'-O)-methyltransferase
MSKQNKPKSASKAQFKGQPKPPPTQNPGSVWLYGLHAVKAAWENPERRCFRLLVAIGHDWEERPPEGCRRPVVQKVDKREIDQIVGEGAVHQGVALEVSLLPEPSLEDIIDMAEDMQNAHIVILDQVSDPHNVGAIMRSAAAFGALAVVLPDRGAPMPSGVLAKVACGAVDAIPLVRVGNLARAMEQVREGGFWTAGLDERGDKTLAEAKLAGGKVALVLGAEGDGLRRLTAENCDFLVKLPTQPPIYSLNVSNAAAVALYELVRV